MTVTVASVKPAAAGSDVLGGYLEWVGSLDMTTQGRRLRRVAAQRFVATFPDLDEWMTRPTPARLVDLRRTGAWPFLTWCFCVGRLTPDVDLLGAKASGNHYVTWARFNPDDVARASAMGRSLGWKDIWVHRVCVDALAMVCVCAPSSR